MYSSRNGAAYFRRHRNETVLGVIKDEQGWKVCAAVYPGPWKPPTECTPALTEESVRSKPPHACCCSRRQWGSVSWKLESSELVSWWKWGFMVPGNMGRNLILKKSGEPGTRQGNDHRAKAAFTRASHSEAGALRNECVCLACLPSASPT